MFTFPAEIVFHRIVPGTALGVLVGDVAYTVLAVRLMRRTGRTDVTAMPFGIDTPTLFAMVFGVLGPVMLATGDATLAWKVGMAVTVVIGVVKMALAFTGDWARRVIPRAALLGSIAAVSILLIAFLPALKVLRDPLVGLISLSVLLLALLGRVRIPFGIPGACAAVLAGSAAAWLTAGLGAATVAAGPAVPAWTMALPHPTLGWLDAWRAALPYLSIAIPFALLTTIGGIDNAESAAAAGDDYRARDILLTEAAATVVAAICGGVVQNTPYIGHPAYKAMGARAGYTLATALVIGVGAAAGGLSWVLAVLPEAAVATILIFIGLEITAQGFLASPARHGPAVAIGFIPVVAAVVTIQAGGILAGVGKAASDLSGEAAASLLTLTVLGNGFILTALLWSAATAFIIERRFALAGLALAVASAASLCGLIHSPLASGALFAPWAPPSAVPAQLAGGYGAASALCCLAALDARRDG